MYICYVDESGTPDIPCNTSHFVLAGISIPVWHWKRCDSEIETIKNTIQGSRNKCWLDVEALQRTA